MWISKSSRLDWKDSGADIESLCKKATLLAIAEFQNGARPAPFVVLRNDFMAVLDSDRGGFRQLDMANVKSDGSGHLCSDESIDTKTK